MKLLKSHAPKIIEFAEIPSESGDLWFAEVHKQLPFVVQRVYYIVGVPEGAERGSHGHKKLDQLIVAMNGSFAVDITDGVDNWSFTLDSPGKALFLPAGLWRTLRGFSQGSICLVLASDCYSSDDYVREYQEYLSWKAQEQA